MKFKITFKADLGKLREIIYILSNYIKKGDCLILQGELGSGKTTFASILIKSLGIKDNVSSPTFTIINEYFYKDLNIKHIDAYRISEEDIGLEELLDDSLVLVEWPEKLEKFIPKRHIKIFLEYLNDEERYITLEILDEHKFELFQKLKEKVDTF